ncbi:hypothetical protein VNO77_04095 [Canavalia gladiata]|uniref:Uncharacterized protein n=1 Tax=Canavalia gladiata TaxID=3824 RepID=A0AAN9RCV0_CANGL
MGLCELPPNMMQFRRVVCAMMMGEANIGGDDDGDSDDDDDDDDAHEQFMVSLDGGVGGSSFHIPSLACETSIQRRDQSGSKYKLETEDVIIGNQGFFSLGHPWLRGCTWGFLDSFLARIILERASRPADRWPGKPFPFVYPCSDRPDVLLDLTGMLCFRCLEQGSSAASPADGGSGEGD